MWGVWINTPNLFDPVAWVGIGGDRRTALAALWKEVTNGWPATPSTPTDRPTPSQ